MPTLNPEVRREAQALMDSIVLALNAAPPKGTPTKREPTKSDPTRTQVIRAEWSREVTRRFKKLAREMTAAFVDGPPFITTNAFDYTSNPTAILEFLAWLDTRINATMFDNFDAPSPEFWQNTYLNRAYTRGAKIARMALRRQAGPVPIGQMLDELAIPSFLTGTATPGLSFGAAGLVSFSQPIHLDAILTLYIREYAALRNITDTMRGQIARVLTEGVQEGLNTRVIAANMVDRVDKIGITRARLIAQTETIRAYNIGSINEGERVGIEADVEVLYLWQSSEDGRVRPQHALWNQDLMTKALALARIGEPNCRCGIEPTVVEDLDSEERIDMRERKKRGLALATR